MHLTILGSGVMMPVPGRRPSGYILEDGDTRILLDCGHTTLASLIERKIDPQSIQAVAITHFHTDHFADLVPLVHARWVDDRLRGNAFRPLTVIGPKTLEERFWLISQQMIPDECRDYPLSFREAGDGDPISVGSLSVRSFSVRHSDKFPCLGYRVASGDKTLVYTGDCRSRQDASFDDAVRGSDLLLMEAGSLAPSDSHSTAGDVLALVERCGIPRALLTHVPEFFIPHIRDVIARCDGRLELAQDGMALALSSG